MEQEMEYIYTVYKEGSISKAADKLYMTQPALSMAVRRVEAKLNAPLFDRGRKPLALTPVGEIYIQKYQEIKLLENDLFSQIQDVQDLGKGSLAIGGTHFILSYVLAPVLTKFSYQYPNINIQLLECSASELEALLLNGQIDLCLKCDECTPVLEPIDYAFRDYVLLAVPEPYITTYDLPDTYFTQEEIKAGAFVSEKPEYIGFEHLAKLPFLALTRGNNLRERLYQLFRENQAEPTIKMQIQQVVTAYHLANSGMGATLTSATIVKKTPCDSLAFYMIESPLMVRDFYAIGRKNRYVSITNRRFIDLLQKYYSIM